MKIASIAGVLAVSGLLFWLLAPANVRDRAIGLLTFASSERQCFNYHKKDFNDPDSAYVDSSYVSTRKIENERVLLRVKVKAKNLMGGYVTEYVECALVRGNVDESATEMARLEEKYPGAAEGAAPAPGPAPTDP
ncbi:MAG: hypothetical protein WBX11_06630 [Thiobacillaceae bacterium]